MGCSGLARRVSATLGVAQPFQLIVKKRMSRKRYGLLALAWLSLAAEAPAQTIALGEGGRAWLGGGEEMDPQFRLSTTELAVGNTPGGVIDFAFAEGWIFPQQIDPGRNLALGAADREGGMNSPLPSISEASLAAMIDGDAETAFRRKASAAGEVVIARGIIMDLDLGARFGVNRIRFFPRNTIRPSAEFKFENDFMRGYALQLNDGSEEASVEGRPQYTTFVRVEDNTEAVVEWSLPLQFVRYVRLVSLSNIGFEVDELEVFGAGFVPEAQYLSDIFDLGDLANWGHIRWSERREGLAGLSAIRVFTRSGRDPTPFIFNRFNADLQEVPWQEAAAVNGVLLDDLPTDEAFDQYNSQSAAVRQALALSQAEHAGLPLQQKAPIRDDLINWSNWSPPYPPEGTTLAGTPIVSPGPRQYFQFRIDFVSRDFLAAAGVGSLSFDLARPVPAKKIVGEIFPREVAAGEVVEFTYGARVGVRPQDTGFNRFEISSPSVFEKIGRIEVLNALDELIAGEDFDAVLAEASLPRREGEFSIESAAAGRFVVGFPLVGDGDLLKISFTTSVLRFGQGFAGSAWLVDPAAPEPLPQSVVPGNAAQLGAADVDPRPVGSEDLTAVDNNLAVRIAIRGSLLGRLHVTPEVFTPNGDGINEAAAVHFEVLRLGVGAPLRVEIRDLSGRFIAAPFAGDRASGRFAAAWDGRDGTGAVVAPGIYLVRVSLATNVGTEAKTGLVRVAY